MKRLEKFPFGGDKWESLAKERKFWYVVGFSEGIFQTCEETYTFFATSILGEELGFRKKAEEAMEVSKELLDEFVEKINPGNGTAAKIVAGLNGFYKDSRNKKIEVNQAIYIVKLELIGAPRQFIEKQTKILRLPLYKDRVDKHQSLLSRNQKYRKAFKKWGKYLPDSISGAVMGA